MDALLWSVKDEMLQFKQEIGAEAQARASCSQSFGKGTNGEACCRERISTGWRAGPDYLHREVKQDSRDVHPPEVGT